MKNSGAIALTVAFLHRHSQHVDGAKNRDSPATCPGLKSLAKLAMPIVILNFGTLEAMHEPSDVKLPGWWSRTGSRKGFLVGSRFGMGEDESAAIDNNLTV